jgi:NDP-sugar pyrophosphorylase family protein
MGEGLVSGEIYRGFWMDIGTAARLRELDRYLSGSKSQAVGAVTCPDSD